MSNRVSTTFLIVTFASGIIIGLCLRSSDAMANNAGDEHAGKITCRSLTVEDAKGRKRIRLAVTDKGPEVRMYDSKGGKRIQIGTRSRGEDDNREEIVESYVSLLDAKENPNVILYCVPGPKDDGFSGGLSVGSTAKSGHVDFNVMSNGEANLTIGHGEDSSGISLLSRPSSAALLSITDNEGEALFSLAGFYKDGFAGLRVLTEKGKEPWKCSK